MNSKWCYEEHSEDKGPYQDEIEDPTENTDNEQKDDVPEINTPTETTDNSVNIKIPKQIQLLKIVYEKGEITAKELEEEVNKRGMNCNVSGNFSLLSTKGLITGGNKKPKSVSEKGMEKLGEYYSHDVLFPMADAPKAVEWERIEPIGNWKYNGEWSSHFSKYPGLEDDINNIHIKCPKAISPIDDICKQGMNYSFTEMRNVVRKFSDTISNIEEDCMDDFLECFNKCTPLLPRSYDIFLTIALNLDGNDYHTFINNLKKSGSNFVKTLNIYRDKHEYLFARH